MQRPARLSTIAHADRRVLSPVSDAKLARLLARVALPPSARVLDLGCGKAELLLRALEASPTATGVGIDRNASFLEDAAREAERRGLRARVELVEGDAWELAAQREPFDTVLSVGAPYLGGDRRATLVELRERLRRGGTILFGDVIFERAPDASELAPDGWDGAHFPTHAEQVALALDVGLTPLFATTSSVDEWDEYEGSYLESTERWVRASPDDPEAEAMRAFARWWYRRYLEWRRGTLGFGWYVYAR